MHVFKFADIGEGLHEGTVAEIYVKVGDTVKEGDSLFSVETDKVTSDIPSPVTGKVTEIRMAVGDVIHVGQEIFVFDDGSGDSAPAPAPKAEEPAPKAEKEEGGASVVGEVKVSNDLIDFSSLGVVSGSKPAAPVAPKAPQAPVQQSSQDSFIDGKKYDGKVDGEFDVIVIGSGPGGYLCAEEAGKAGFKVLIVEKKYWGGVCLNTGCIPTKSLLETAHALDYLKEFAKYGVEATQSKIDYVKTWQAMHARKAEVVKKLSSGVQFLMKSAKATSVFGEAKFVGAHEVEVEGKVYRGKYIVLATGSTPNTLSVIPGFEEGLKKGTVITSEEAINLKDELPKAITIIGGGVIGVEFASVFASVGIKVTIIQNIDKLLPGNDPDIQKLIEKVLKEKNIEILFNTQTKSYDASKKTLVVERDGKEEKLVQDYVLVSVGRKPYSINAADMGVKLNERGGVEVDKHQRTNVRNFYAIGDVVGKSMLAHVAYAHAQTVVYHLINDDVQGTYENRAVPGCIYTDPEIAFTGLTEAQAKEAGKNYLVSKYAFSTLGKAIAKSKTEGFVKLVVDKETGEIYGAQMVGENVTDYIAEVCLAMDNELTVFEMAKTIHPHPTFSEIVWEAARSASLKIKLASKK